MSFHFVVWQWNVSLIVVVLTTALVAVLLDEAGGLIWRRRRRARLRHRDELVELRRRHVLANGGSAEQPAPLDGVGAETTPSIAADA